MYLLIFSSLPALTIALLLIKVVFSISVESPDPAVTLVMGMSPIRRELLHVRKDFLALSQVGALLLELK